MTLALALALLFTLLLSAESLWLFALSAHTSRVSRIVGVDACKGGWVSISRDLGTGELSTELDPSVEALLKSGPRPAVLAIDIPIGLTDAGPRQCDRLARELLGTPRSSSVFPAPVRAALSATTRKEADRIARSIDGRGVGAQAWGLYARIREVDRLVRASPIRKRLIYEVHPEVSFASWNGGAPIGPSKKSAEGASARRRLVDAHFGAAAMSTIRKKHSASRVADDDILDAFAALWTAERICQGRASVVPDPPPVDSMGIEMGMWY